MLEKIPSYVLEVMQKLEEKNFEVFIVGGCVRDLLLNKEPKDWDITTNAKPEEIMEIFPDSVYENEFGTVGIKIKKQRTANGEQESEETEIVEVTTYRIETKYSDRRHPDEIRFAKTLEEDLSRRDFTINSLALKIGDKRQETRDKRRETRNKRQETRDKEQINSKSETINPKQFENYKSQILNDFEIVDLFDGEKDLENKIIRAVGDANERFNEDALRMMRAVRFASSLGDKKQETSDNKQETRDKKQANSKYEILNTKQVQNSWEIEEKTFEAIRKNARNLKFVSMERIRDEFQKIILSNNPSDGVELLRETGLLQYIIPEIEIGIGVTQSHHHYYGPYNTVYKHLLASLEKCPSSKLEVRLASLLHDIGKPKSKRGEGENATFYSHEYIGAKIAERILERLKFSRKVIDKTVMLIKNHMFYYNVDEVGESGVRRVVQKVGIENISDLIDVRIADRLGSGVPKAVPYKLRHFKFMVEKVSHDAISVKQLKINGNDLMQELKLAPGPKIGTILDVMLARVIDEPELNKREKLLELAAELEKENLDTLRAMAKKKIEEEQEAEEKLIKKKYKVG